MRRERTGLLWDCMTRDKKKVSFFIVGQPKSGTSALANFLSQHPAICMAEPKEPGYFAKDHIEENEQQGTGGAFLKARTLTEYEHHFSHGKPEEMRGEATTIYLYSRVAAQEIHNYNPDAKIIIMLRNPVSFLHALHMQHVNDGSEDEPDFEKALAKEADRKQGINIPKRAPAPSHLHYSERAKYAEQIERYTRLFPRKNILFLTMEDFQADNRKVYQQVLRFLEVDENFEPQFKQVNGSTAPRSYVLHKALSSPTLKKTLFNALGPYRYSKLKSDMTKVVMKPAARSPLSDQIRERLMHETLQEVERTAKLTGLDLATKWDYSPRSAS